MDAEQSRDAPAVSVVIGCVASPEGARPLLEALAAQADGAEIIVGAPEDASDELRRAFPEASFHVRAGALVPALWRDGIDRSRGEVVALTISPMIPADDWIATALAGARRHGGVGGAIDPADDISLADLAECLCRYARDMTPFQARETADLPGDNSAYRRELLLGQRPLWANGFWEPPVNAALLAAGVRLRHDPELRMRQGRSAGPWRFVRQRLAHGMAHGQQRGARMSRSRNLMGIVGAPAVPALLLLRTYRELARRRRLGPRELAALPWLLLFDLAWAAGEARGHLGALLGR